MNKEQRYSKKHWKKYWNVMWRSTKYKLNYEKGLRDMRMLSYMLKEKWNGIKCELECEYKKRVNKFLFRSMFRLTYCHWKEN